MTLLWGVINNPFQKRFTRRRSYLIEIGAGYGMYAAGGFPDIRYQAAQGCGILFVEVGTDGTLVEIAIHCRAANAFNLADESVVFLPRAQLTRVCLKSLPLRLASFYGNNLLSLEE